MPLLRNASFGLGTHSQPPCTNRSIGKALTDDPGKRVIRAGSVVHANCDAVVVPEIELGEIPVKVLLGTMLVDADHAALEDRKDAFDGVGVNGAACFRTGRIRPPSA
jgi:hypothetical protein